MVGRSATIRRFIRNFPGFKTFGILTFMPFFYVAGAALEYVMIHWTFGETNFYKTYKRNQSRLEAERRLAVLLHDLESKGNPS